MKKILLSITLLLTAILVVACNGVDLAKLESSKFAITYSDAETHGGVTKNITLPTEITEGKDTIKVSWASTNEAVISTGGVVVQTDKEETVQLTPTLTLGSKTKQRDDAKITIKVLKKGDTPSELGAKIYSFDISKSAWTGYTADATAATLFDTIGAATINVQRKGTITDLTNTAVPSIVMRGSEPSKAEEAFIEFNTDNEVKGISLKVAHWNTFKDNLTKAAIQVKDGASWVDKVLFTDKITSTDKDATVEVLLPGINAKEFRIFISGDDQSQFRGARVVISELNFHGEAGAVVPATDKEYVDAAIASIVIPVKAHKNLDLKTTISITLKGTAKDVTVVWTSSNEASLSPAGVVVRGEEAVEVTLTATYKLNVVEEIKTHVITVLAKDGPLAGVVEIDILGSGEPWSTGATLWQSYPAVAEKAILETDIGNQIEVSRLGAMINVDSSQVGARGSAIVLRPNHKTENPGYAFVEFKLTEVVKSISMDVTGWGAKNEKLPNAMIQVFKDGAWVTVLDFTQTIGTTVKEAFVSVTAELNSNHFRIYATEISATAKDRLIVYSVALTITEALVQKNKLDALITEVEGLIATDYTDVSFTLFTTALTAAKVVAADDKATQVAVDEALVNLDVAHKALVKLGNKTLLVAELELAKLELAKNIYSDESLAVLQAAVDAGDLIVADLDATQEVVDASLATIKEAILGLVDISIIDVSNEAELRIALLDVRVRVINILADIVLTYQADRMERIIIARNDVTINGNENTISVVKNQGWEAYYLIQVYEATGVVLNNISFNGGDAALLLNGSEVKLTGKIVISNVEFGGIELGKGLLVTINPILTNEAVITHDTETSATPTVWLDGVTDGFVDANFTTYNNIAKSQIFFYLHVGNIPSSTILP